MTTKQIQLLLAHLGYEVTPDGIPGPQTREVVRKFQSEYSDLTMDGVAGPSTEDAIVQAVVSGWQRPAGTQTNAKPDTDVKDSLTTGSFWDDIPNFTREEFKCKCGGQYCNGFPAEPQEAMVRIAQAARDYFGRPATVVSGLRCERWNAIQGGVENSQHRYGEACDLAVSGVSADALLAFLQNYPGVRYAYKINATNVHFDIPKGAR